MSAPNAGRQSPDPEQQHGSQGTDAQAAPNDQGANQDSTKDQLKDLSSNPTAPLEHASQEKTKKGNGNPALGGN